MKIKVIFNSQVARSHGLEVDLSPEKWPFCAYTLVCESGKPDSGLAWCLPYARPPWMNEHIGLLHF